jgi:tetratricopeptide (TPR) repeat protein
MAGYDPDIIVNRTDTNFFREWADQLSGRIAYNDKLYPSTKQRANFLLGYLENIKAQIAVFELGLRFYQKGEYDEALECLTYFRRQFPCREVFNNIGLIYYQKAFSSLAVYNPRKAYRFKLATVVDTETRAEFGTRGLATTDDFNRNIEYAIDSFEAARVRDFHYIPARVNLASALILYGDYSRALAVSKEAINIHKDDQNALHNFAIALYLFGRIENIRTTEKAVEILNAILYENPSYPYHLNALYNLGTIFFEQGKDSKAEKVWRRYLKVGPMEGYADRIIKKIGKTSKKSSKENYQSNYQIPPPIRIGYANRETKKKLNDFSKISVELTTAEATYYTKDAVKVLVIRGFVKHVETPAMKATKLSNVLLRYGKPNRIISAASGLQTYLYEKFALDIRDDKVLKVIYFKEID